MFKSFLIAMAVVLVGACSAPESGSVDVTDAYSYATTSVQKNGAVFFQIHNATSEDIRITGASADVAERVELHTHAMDGGIMMMREVEGYDVPAGESVALEPMGHHIMLMGLNAPLESGTTFPLVLNTNSGEIAVDIAVRNPGE